MKRIAYHPTNDDIVDIMINLTDLNNKKDILDTGFGEGAFLFKLVDNKNIIGNIHGIEIDKEFFDSAYMRLNNLNRCFLYNKNFLSKKFNKKFDLIIGNPPYIKNDNLSLNIKNNIREITQTGEGNIYYAFILKSIELLKPNGELIYIIPYDFFYNTHAKYLRKKLITEGDFEIIINFSDKKIFDNVYPESIIIKWIKKDTPQYSSNKLIKIFNIKNNLPHQEFIKYKFDIFNKKLFEKYYISNFNVDGFWNLSKNKFFNKFEYIKNYVNVHVGMVSGSEKSFVINKNDLNFSKDEEKFIKQFIKAKDINGNLISEKNLNSYLFLEKGDIRDEKILKEKFSNIFNYLQKDKNKLINRYGIKKETWYLFSSNRNKKQMDDNKNKYIIVSPCITRKRKNIFSLYKGTSYISGDCLFLTGNKEDIFYLFGLLNTKFFINYYFENGAKKGERLIFAQKLFSDLKIPLLKENIRKKISNLVEENFIFNSEIKQEEVFCKINNIVLHNIE